MYGHTYLMSNIIENLFSYEKLLGEKENEVSKFLDKDLESSSEELNNGGV
jgi:hypothetical protein